MPELPEVETARRVIEPQIKGKKIVRVNIERPQVIAHPESEEFKEMVSGASIKGMFRRGKFLGIELVGGRRIIVHFRMTGTLLAAPKDYPAEKHTHITMELDDGNEIRYTDPRRFGRFWLLGDEADTYTGMDRLGIEPFDSALTAAYLESRWSRRKKTVKDCLLDQSAVAGIGNIYSDEILFVSKINPQRKACELQKSEFEKLAANIPATLSYFIEKNAISKEDYLAGLGKEYRNTPYLRAYGREGKPCVSCGGEMRRVVITGRSSVYCPKCQK